MSGLRRRRYFIACAVCGDLLPVKRTDLLTCSFKCRRYLRRHPELLKELRDLCSNISGATPFRLLQAKALNALTDCAGVRLTKEFEERLLSGDLQPQELITLVEAAGIKTNNGSRLE